MTADARELAAGFDLESLTPAFYADPYPTYRALREHAPVKRLRNGSYFLTRYDDLVTAYKTTRAFSSVPRMLTAFGSWMSTRFCRQCQLSVRYIAPVST